MFSIKMDDEDQYKRRQQQKTQRHYYRDISLDAFDDEKHYSFCGSSKKIIVKEDDSKDDTSSTTHNSPVQVQEQRVRDDEHKQQGENKNTNDHHKQVAITNTTTTVSENRQQRQQQNHDIEDEKAESKQQITKDLANNEKDDDDDSINIGLLLTKNRNRILNQKNEFLKVTNLTNNSILEESFQCEVALLDLETSIDPVSSSVLVSSLSSIKEESSLEYPSIASCNDSTNSNDVSQLQDHVTTNRDETETTTKTMTTATTVSSTALRFPSLTDIEEITTPDCQDVFKTVDDGDDAIDHESHQSSTRFIEYNGIRYDNDSRSGDHTSHTFTSNIESISNSNNELELRKQDLYSIDESHIGDNYANVPALNALEYRLLQQNQPPPSDSHHLEMQYCMDRIPRNDDENDAELEYAYKQSLQEYYQDQIQSERVWNTGLSSPQPPTNMALRGIDQYGVYPTQTVQHMRSNASANSNLSDFNGVHQNQQFIPHRQDDVSRQYNYNTADSISSNTLCHQHYQQYQPDNNSDVHSRVMSNRFQTQMNINTSNRRYSSSSTCNEQDLIHRRGSSTSSKDVITKDSFSSDSSYQHRSEYDRCNQSIVNDISSPASLSPILSRTATILDDARLAEVNGAESSTMNNDNNKEKIEIEVSPGVFLPLHGSEETQQVMYEALLKSFNSTSLSGGERKEDNKTSTTEQNVSTDETKNGLVKCTCLSCSTTLYCIGNAVAVVCYKCYEISPITRTSNNEKAITVDSNTNNNGKSNDHTKYGIGLGMSEQSYLDLVADISKKFTNMKRNRPSIRVRQISLLRLGENAD